jgi:hypothetical protein
MSSDFTKDDFKALYGAHSAPIRLFKITFFPTTCASEKTHYSRRGSSRENPAEPQAQRVSRESGRRPL